MKLHCFEQEELSADEDIASCAETLAKNGKVNIMTDNYPMFKRVPEMPILDELLTQTEENETNNELKNDNDDSTLEDAQV